MKRSLRGVAFAALLSLSTAAAVIGLTTRHLIAAVVGFICMAASAIWQMFGDALKPIVQDRVNRLVTDTIGWRLTGYGKLYRRYLANDLRFMDAARLGSAVESGNLELEDVFVDIDLPRVAVGRADGAVLPPENASARTETGTGVSPSQGRVAAPRRLSIWDYLDRESASVIAVLGAPGSGKTTLLRHVALTMAQDPGKRRRTVPALVTLREHAERITSDSDTTLAQVLRATAPAAIRAKEPQSANWWRRSSTAEPASCCSTASTRSRTPSSARRSPSGSEAR